ncbi:MAG: 7-cyano-7-deazaguanine synthase QueC [Oceanicaulis sp.]
MNTDTKPGAALVLFSGGQDSATCLAWALSRFDRVETIGFSYGQRHGVEMQARERVRAAVAEAFPAWAQKLGEDVVVDISGYGALAESALTREAEFAMSEKGLPTTFVPGRNLVFLAIAGAHAYRRATPHLVTGVCQTDYSGYPDCREATMRAQEQALSLGLDEQVRIETPLMHLTKAETWALAHDLGGEALVDLIIEESHTCYRGDREHRHAWGYGCGDCPACELRAKGFAEWRASA